MHSLSEHQVLQSEIEQERRKGFCHDLELEIENEKLCAEILGVENQVQGGVQPNEIHHVDDRDEYAQGGPFESHDDDCLREPYRRDGPPSLGVVVVQPPSLGVVVLQPVSLAKSREQSAEL